MLFMLRIEILHVHFELSKVCYRDHPIVIASVVAWGGESNTLFSQTCLLESILANSVISLIQEY